MQVSSNSDTQTVNKDALPEFYFSISDQTLNAENLAQSMQNAECGAFVSFSGWVRNHNEGKDVSGLIYEAYAALANKEGLRIIEEAKTTFGIQGAICIHRIGELAIGDSAVWVGVNAPHRDAAFAACRYIIDEVKARVPIWKKEFYIDGEVEWVDCRACAHGSSKKA